MSAGADLVFEGVAGRCVRHSSEQLDQSPIAQAFAPSGRVIELWTVRSERGSSALALLAHDVNGVAALSFSSQPPVVDEVQRWSLPYALALDLYAFATLSACDEPHARAAMRLIAFCIANGALTAMPQDEQEHAQWRTAAFLLGTAAFDVITTAPIPAG